MGVSPVGWLRRTKRPVVFRPRRRAQAIVAEHSVFGYESTDSESPATVPERLLSAADEVGGEAADFVAVENVKHS